MFEELDDSKSTSIKEIYENILYFLNDLKKRWYLLLAFGLAGGAYLWYYAATSDVHYEAKLSFVVKNETSSSGGMDDVLSQLGWSGSQSTTNMAKITKIALSKSVIMEAMYDSVVIKGRSDLMANHMVDIYGYTDKWGKINNGFKKFEISRKYSDSSRAQNSAFNSILNLVRGRNGPNSMFTITSDDNTDVVTFDIRTRDEELSYYLGTHIYQSLNNFYVEDDKKGASEAVAVLKRETDSVSRLLKSKEYQLANTVDRNYGIILSKNQVNQDVIRRDIEMLTALYTQMRQRLESNQFGLRYSTSMFEVLENPVLPLDRKEKSTFIYGLIGMSIGFAFIAILLIARRFLLDELK
jgi:hypothetical protein